MRPLACLMMVCQLTPRSKLHWSILCTFAFAIVLVLALNIELSNISGSNQKSFQRNLRRNQSSLGFGVVGIDMCQCPTAQAAEPAATQKPVDLQPLPSTEFYMNILSTRSPRRNDSFDPQMNATELAASLNLLWAFLDLCDQYRIEVMLYGGTLLGSYRHHGIMPWDDDVDLLLKESDMDLLERALSNNSMNMELAKAGRWKVWNKTACITRPYSWCWPYLDLSFYRVQGNLIYDTVTAYGYNYSYPVQFTFPLHKRPFMGRWVAAPRDALRFLGYDKNPTGDCISLYYSHKFESSPKSPVMYARCESLSVNYPFVIRVPSPNAVGPESAGLLETLRYHGGWPVYTVLVEEPPGAYNYDYSILPIV